MINASRTHENEESRFLSVANAWLSKVEEFCGKGDVDGFVGSFQSAGWWKDVLTLDLDYNSFKNSEIKPYLIQSGLSLPKWKNLRVESIHSVTDLSSLSTPGSLRKDVDWMGGEYFIRFETDVLLGTGFLKLQIDPKNPENAKASLLFTQCSELKGYEGKVDQKLKFNSKISTPHSSDEQQGRDMDYKTLNPKVVIIGGGQNGLMLAARLKMLGVDHLVVEKNGRIGDCWRFRYDSLCLHDPIWVNGFPYVEYPSGFPTFIPKNQFADWLEYYARRLSLSVSCRTELLSNNCTYDSTLNRWNLKLRVRLSEQKEEILQLSPAYVVMATGLSVLANWPSMLHPKNSQISPSGVGNRSRHLVEILHASQFRSAAKYKGKKVLVIGACNSAHDISEELVRQQACEVVMLQRSSTYVLSREKGLQILLKGCYGPDMSGLDKSDFIFQSYPLNVLEKEHEKLTLEINQVDAELLSGLKSVGFNIDPYASGMLMKFFRRGGGYYIDVGCSQLIIEKKIKLKVGQEVESLIDGEVKLTDGDHIAVDAVVCATGYRSIKEHVKDVLSEKVYDSVGQVWGQDPQGEMAGVWRLNQHPGFWIMCGNIMQARIYSKHVAHQILMQELGIYDKNWVSKIKKINVTAE